MHHICDCVCTDRPAGAYTLPARRALTRHLGVVYEHTHTLNNTYRRQLAGECVCVRVHLSGRCRCRRGRVCVEETRKSANGTQDFRDRRRRRRRCRRCRRRDASHCRHPARLSSKTVLYDTLISLSLSRITTITVITPCAVDRVECVAAASISAVYFVYFLSTRKNSSSVCVLWVCAPCESLSRLPLTMNSYCAVQCV